MAHKLAATHQNAFRIGNLGTCKESDIHMSLKDIHISKCRIGDACSRVAIVQALLGRRSRTYAWLQTNISQFRPIRRDAAAAIYQLMDRAGRDWRVGKVGSYAHRA